MADDTGNGWRRKKLDEHYNLVVTQLLKYQSATIGLFPLHTSEKGKESHIRDNIYCAISVWSLSLAYRHIDDDQGRTHALEQSAVKCMRGILFCYMRQCNKVEQFKKDQRWRNSLHAKFHVETGDEVATDNEYNHFQIDIISLYLLTLAQMTVSGLFIIFTTDEVNFIQNLVYYVERTYRTADYGIWERGTRYNDGSRELSSSSIGMARAALEAVNGLNLYGLKGTSWSVIYTDPDAHNRNTSILNTLLPRESRSKETDAALLCILGYPAFAVVDEKLHKETKERLVNTLKGEYGLKRFLRDGYGTLVEPKDKRHYDRSVLKSFSGIEAEWPIFYVYLALEAYFLGDQDDAANYMKIVEGLLVTLKDPGDDTEYDKRRGSTKDENKVLPKYYYVPQEYIEQEKGRPGSVERLPNTDEEVFLWGHSLYLLAKLLLDGLVTVSEIDPLNRHSFEKSAKMKSVSVHYRYSLFENSGNDLVIQVCLISENRNLQSSLATYGVVTQTTKEVEPIQICAPSHLVKIYEELGVNKKLGLSGRPNRPIGVLGTSKIYRVLGKTVATYPILLDESDFYMSLDMSLLIDGIKTILAFIRKRWNMQGRPTLCIILRDHNFRGSHFKEMLDFMAALKNGNVNGIRVLVGRLQTFVSTACVEHLDFLRIKQDYSFLDIHSDNLFRPNETVQPSVGFKSVYAPNLREEMNLEHDEEDYYSYDHKSTEDIVELYKRTTSLRAKMDLLNMLLSRHDYHFKLMGRSILEEIDEIYRQASYLKLWSVVRYSAALLGKVVDSLAPSITTMLVSGRQVTIGIFGQNEIIISEPMTPASIQSVIYSTCKPNNAREAVLQQEMLIYLSDLLSTKPELFTGMLRLRVGWIIQAMKNQLSLCTEDVWGQKPGSIYSLPPSAIKQLLKSVLNKKGSVLFWDVAPRSWLQTRQLEGALNRVPSPFYASVWKILECVPGGLRLCSHYLPQQPTLSEMTANEVDFSLRVEEMLSKIKRPEFRQSIVELLTVIATILERNPELEVRQCIDLDEIHGEAVKLFLNDPSTKETSESAFYNLGQADNSGTMAYYARAIVNKLLDKSIYRVLGKTVATYPILLDESDFYMSLDMSLLIDGIKTILAFIRKRWNMQGRPTLCIILRDHNFRGSHFKEMLDFMAALKNGNVNGIRVLVGRLQTFVSTACVEHLDFLRIKQDYSFLDIHSDNLFRPNETVQPSVGFKSVYAPNLREEMNLEHDEEDYYSYDHKSTEDIVELYKRTTSLRAKMDLLNMLLSRHDYHFKLMGRSILEEIDEIYRQASYLKLWSVVRYSAALLGKVVDSLAPSITTMLVSGRQVTIGIFGQNEIIISEPMTPASIQSVIYSTCKPNNAREAVLQQEMLIYLSDLLSTKPELFTGMLRLRVGWIIQAMKNQLSLCTEDVWGQKPGSIYSLPPSAIKQLLKSVLNKKGSVLFWDVAPRSWLQTRQLEGALNRVPSPFYASVWKILECVPGGLRLCSHYLPQQPTLSEMTANEVDFSLRVEEMLSKIKRPEFRQSIVELLTVIATILERNPELEVRQCIDLDEIHGEAVKLFLNDPSTKETSESAFYNLGQADNSGTMAYYARAIVNKLLDKSIYRVLGKTVATYPILLDESDFYMSLDMSLLIDGIKTILAFIRKRWNMQGRPTLCIILRDHNFRGSHFKEMLDFMAALKNGNVNGIRVLVGRLQTFVSTACVEHLDFLRIKQDYSFLDIHSDNLFRPNETVQPSVGFKSVYAPNLREEMNLEHDEEDYYSYDHKSTEDIVELYKRTTSLRAKMDLLNMLLSRHDYHFKLMGRSILEEIDEIYRQASYLKLWSVVRYSAALLGKVVDSLAPSITTMLVSGRQVTIGIFGQNEIIISEPMTPASIQSVIYSTCKPNNAREAVLQQEMLIYLSDLLSTKPELFTGMLRLRVGWIIQAMKNQLSLCTEDVWGQKPGSIYSLPPSAIKQLLKSVLNKKGSVLFWDVAPRSWLQTRQLEGALNRVPSPFYASVWKILECVPGGLRLCSHYLPQQPTLSEMTANEVDFSLRVEEMLSKIKRPEFRQSIVELLTVIATILERNPELEVRQCIDLDEIHGEAVKLFLNDPSTKETSESAFYNLGQADNSGTMAYYARAIVNKLLDKSVSFRSENACAIS